MPFVFEEMEAHDGAGKSLEGAVYAVEKLEETARFYLMLRGAPTRFLTPNQVADLGARFPS